VWYDVVQSVMVRYGMVQYGMVRYGTAWHGTGYLVLFPLLPKFQGLSINLIDTAQPLGVASEYLA